MDQVLVDAPAAVAAAWDWLVQYADGARELVADAVPVLKPLVASLPDWLVLVIAAGLIAGLALAGLRFLRLLGMWAFRRRQFDAEQPALRGDLSPIRTDTATLIAGQERQIENLKDIGSRQSFEPALSLREVPSGTGDRLFFFGAMDRIPFFGREQELKRLQEWMLSAGNLSWALVTGPGGVGKSRLAFELAKRAIENGWHAGFLGRETADQFPDAYDRFAPSKPTLMVIDYPAERPEQVGAILRTIRDRTAGLAHPVRLLLLERNGHDGQWWTRFAAGQDVDLAVAKGPELELTDPGDHALFEILAWAARPTSVVQSSDVLSELREIDPQGRPLFAALVGSAIKDGRRMRDLSKAALLNDVLKREARRWKTVAGGKDALRRHRNAVALATMVGGLRLPEEVDGLDAVSFPFSAGQYDETLVREMTGKPAANFVAPLEPDIVGEWFVLRHLACVDLENEVPWDAFSSPRSALLNAAHSRLALGDEDAQAFAVFLDRLAADFPDEASESGLYRAPSMRNSTERLAIWAAGARSAIGRFGVAGKTHAAQAIYADLKAISSELADNEMIAVEAALAGLNLIAFSGVDESHAAAVILADLQEMAAARPASKLIATIATRGEFSLKITNRLREDLTSIFDKLGVPKDERVAVRNNLSDAILAEMLISLGEKLPPEQKEMLKSRVQQMEDLFGFFRQVFTEDQLFEALIIAEKNVIAEFLDSMRD